MFPLLHYVSVVLFGSACSGAAVDHVGVEPFCQKMYSFTSSNIFVNVPVFPTELRGCAWALARCLCAASKMLYALRNMIANRSGKWARRDWKMYVLAIALELWMI
jgi:hypothetical protein